MLIASPLLKQLEERITDLHSQEGARHVLRYIMLHLKGEMMQQQAIHLTAMYFSAGNNHGFLPNAKHAECAFSPLIFS